MRSLLIDIQQELERGKRSHQEIARILECPVSWVDECHKMMKEYEDELNKKDLEEHK